MISARGTRTTEPPRVRQCLDTWREQPYRPLASRDDKRPPSVSRSLAIRADPPSQSGGRISDEGAEAILRRNMKARSTLKCTPKLPPGEKCCNFNIRQADAPPPIHVIND